MIQGCCHGDADPGSTPPGITSSTKIRCTAGEMSRFTTRRPGDALLDWRSPVADPETSDLAVMAAKTVVVTGCNML